MKKIDQLFSSSQLIYDGNDLRPQAFPNRKAYVLSDRVELKNLENSIGPWMNTLDPLSDEEIKNGVFYIYFTYDSDAFPFLKRIKDNGGVFVSPNPSVMSKTEYACGINRHAHEALRETQELSHRISHFHHFVHENICEAIEITKHLEGDYIEVGVYLGGSALTALNFMENLKRRNWIKPRRMFLLDTFNGFNYEEAAMSSDALWKNTHKLFGVEQTIEHIKQTFKLANATIETILQQNNICNDPLPNELEKIVVLNLDVDQYDPTLSALTRLSDKVVSGGIIICEDPASTPALYGAFLAMEEFLATEKGQQYFKVFKGGQYFLLKR